MSLKPTVRVSINQRVSQIPGIASRNEHSGIGPESALAMLTDRLQQHEQLAAVHLFVRSYRPLAFVMEQSYHFVKPLALLLGFPLERYDTWVTALCHLSGSTSAAPGWSDLQFSKNEAHSQSAEKPVGPPAPEAYR